MANSTAGVLFGPLGKFLADSAGKGATVTPTFTPGPLFSQGQTATTDWLNQLTAMQNDPTGNWGQISPDWADMWQQTQQQVQNYFNGTATSPGVNDQIKASFAQRGMSGDPASSFLLSESGANQASDLTNLAAQQNISKQTFANQGQQNWLNSMANFQKQTTTGPGAGVWNTIVQPSEAQNIMGIVGPVASAAASAYTGGASGAANNSWLNSYLQSSSGQSSSGQSSSGQSSSGQPNYSPLTVNG